MAEGLVVAQEGLSILRQTYVQRSNPPEGAAHASLTALAESIAWELNVPGATEQDLSAALAFLKTVNTENPPSELSEYIPFLESRLAALRKTSAQTLNRGQPLDHMQQRPHQLD